MRSTISPTVRGRNPVSTALETHPVGTFFTATLTISWGLWAIAFVVFGGADEFTRPMMIPGAFGPALAAALVTYLRGDDLGAWAGRIVDWRVPPRWYVLAVGIPALSAVGATALYVSAGGPTATSRIAGLLPVVPVLILVNGLVGGGNEEPGWRGFALPRLSPRYGAFTSSLVIGVVWAVWHFPLFLMGAPRTLSGSLPLYTVLVIAFSVLLTWAYESTGGSVLLVLLFHAAINTSTSFVPVPRNAIEPYGLLVDLSIVTAVLAITLVVLAYDAHGDDGVFELEFRLPTGIAALLTLAGFLLSALGFVAMPDRMTTHWTVSSSLTLVPNRTLPATPALVAIPTAAFILFVGSEALHQYLRRPVRSLLSALVIGTIGLLVATHLLVLVGNGV